MAPTPETGERRSGIARKLIVPAAISLAGSALGFLLTNRQKLRDAAPKLREAAPDLGGVGELTSDLREKIDEVLGRKPTADAGGDIARAREVDWTKFEERRRARRERRERRGRRSRR
jgi:hypothetical protein